MNDDDKRKELYDAACAAAADTHNETQRRLFAAIRNSVELEDECAERVKAEEEMAAAIEKQRR
jgi:hypothetical protein